MSVVLEYERVAELLGVESDKLFNDLTHDGSSKLIDTTDRNLVTFGSVFILAICLEGSMVISLNGFVNSVKEGDLMAILPNSVVRTSQHAANYRARVLLGKVKSQIDIIGTMASIPEMTHYPVVSISRQEQTLLFRLFDYIAITTADATNLYRNNILNKIFMLLCYETSNIYRQRFSLKMKISENEMIFHTFLDALSHHCFEHREVGWYAKYMRLSPRTFGDKIKKATGKTPSEWIDKIVIDNAQTLLSSTNLSVSEIASKLCFANASFFCQYYRRRTGLSPQEWRHRKLNK